MASKVGPAAPFPEFTTIFNGLNALISTKLKVLETYAALASLERSKEDPFFLTPVQFWDSAKLFIAKKSSSSSKGLDPDLTIFIPL